MTRDPVDLAPRALERIAADIPADLAQADSLLTSYGRWAVTSSRGGRAHTLERQFNVASQQFGESLESWRRRCSQVPTDPLMPTPVAMVVQRVLASLPDRERIVLAALYVPRRIPAAAQLQILKIAPQHSRALHLSGLRRFDALHTAAVRR